MSTEEPPSRRERRAAGDPAGLDGSVPPRPPMPAWAGPPLASTGGAARGDDRVGGEASLPPIDEDDDGRLPTAQLEMAAFGPHLVAGEWLPAEPPRRRSVAPWALGMAIAALVAAVFVGWLLPLGVVAVVLAVVSLRRRHDSRRTAVWALVLALLAIVYSAGWLLWTLPQLDALRA